MGEHPPTRHFLRCLTIAMFLAGCGAGSGTTPTPATPTPGTTPTPAATASLPIGTSACVVEALAGKPGEEGAADGVGDAARFSWEGEYIATDSSGAMYITDTANHAIRKMTPDGTVTTFAGKLGESGDADGVASVARFNRPNGLAFGADGTLYVADEENRAIRTISPDGTVTTLDQDLGFRPTAIVLDAQGNVYVGGWEGNVIMKITPDGTATDFAGKRGQSGDADGKGPDARFGVVVDMRFDTQGTMWVVEWRLPETSGSLRKVTPDGTVTTVRSDWGYFGTPGMLWVDPSGDMYATSYFHSTVMKISPDGTVTLLAGQWNPEGDEYREGPGDVARLRSPIGIAGDGTGLFYIVGDSAVFTMRCDF